MPEEKNPSSEEEDTISKSIGEYGRWQLMFTFILSLFNIPCTFHIFVPTFHARERDTWCARPSGFEEVDAKIWKDFTQPDGFCQMFDPAFISLNASGDMKILSGATLIPCDKWEFDDDGTTIISEFGLLCDRQYLNNVAEMVFLAGVAIGGLLSGVISDRYGRKKTLMASVLIQTILGVSIAFNPIFELYLVLRCILGLISVSVVFSGFVLAMELVGGMWRTVAGISFIFPNSLGYIIISGTAYLVRDWRNLQLAISLPSLIFLSLWCVLPESPRWLLAMGRTEEVLVILKKAARFNKRELPHNIDKQLMPIDKSKSENENVGVMDLFKTARLRKITFILFIMWFTLYLVYYGLVLNVGSIGGNLYVNSVLSGLVEVPAIAISIGILLKLGRRWPLCITLSFAGVFCLLTVPIVYMSDDFQWLITTFAMSGKFLISSSNAVMPLFTAELYPTTIRNIGVGASNVSAGIALMLVPYLWEMAKVHSCVPMSVLGVCGLVGGVCVLFLPETGNKALQDTIDEEDEIKSG